MSASSPSQLAEFDPRSAMPSSDRAFRALAREQPQLVAVLLELVLPELVPAGLAVAAEHVDDPHLDAPPTLDADWAARVGDVLFHLEAQAYGQEQFPKRLFRYHLGFVLRYPEHRVDSNTLRTLVIPRRPR